MPANSDDPRKRACDELAALLVSEPGLRTLRLLTLTGTVVPTSGARGNTPEAAPTAGTDPAYTPIGIWKPEVDDDGVRFVRSAGDPEDALWPPTPVLRPKRALLPLRICLLGESTAAGWVYAPELTLAALLDRQLARGTSAGRYEVVDLTRVDLGPDKLVEVATSCLQLDPDIVVVFAGNNWPVRSPRFPDLTIEESQEIALAVEQDGFAGFARLRSRQTERLAHNVLGKLAEIFDRGGASVVLVVPEVELSDWERARPVAWLPGDGCARWYDLYAQARSLAERGREGASALLDVAEKLISLDSGTCPISHRFASRALGWLGRSEEAARAARREIETRSHDNDPSLPGVTLPLQDLLREAARTHAWGCVDLPEVLAATSLSDRRIFLDYCHLTAEGMQVAAAAIAWHVLLLAEPDAAALASTRAEFVTAHGHEPPPDVEARAHFLTALYHGHWSTSDSASDEASRHFRAALHASPTLAQQALRAYLLSRAAPGAALAAADVPAMGTGGHTWTARFAYLANLDASTCRTAMEVLRDVDPTAADEYHARLLAAHDMGRHPADLLNPIYAYRPLDRFERACGLTHERTAFYRAPGQVSEFIVVADGTRDIVITWTARLAQGAGQGLLPLAISLNGHPVAEAALTTSWQDGTANLPRARLEPGINRLTFSWPPPVDGDEAKRRIVERLGAGLDADLHPVFGELFSLAASPADR